MTPNNFDSNFETFLQAIQKQTSWRKLELSQIKLSINPVEDTEDNINALRVRSALVMLYAHWEGWVKQVFRIYLNFVDKLGLRYSDLSKNFLGIALKAKIDSLKQSSSPDLASDFAKFLIDEFDHQSKLRKFRIDTESNLSSKVIGRLLTQFGIAAPNELITSEKF